MSPPAPSLRRRVFIGFTLTVLVILAASTLSGFWLDHTFDQLSRRLTEEGTVETLTAEFQASVLRELEAGHRYLITGDWDHWVEFLERAAATYALQQQVIVRSEGSSAVTEALIPIQNELTVAEVIISRAHRLSELGRAEEAQEALRQGGESIDGVLTGLEELAAARTESRRQAVTGVVRRTRFTGIFIVLILSLGFVGSFLVARSSVNALIAGTERLTSHAEQLKTGDLATRTETRLLPVEIRTLGEALNDASRSLEELEEKKTALQRAERLSAVGLTLSGVAHELNNPLTTILVTAEELIEYPDHSDSEEQLEVVRDQARRARALVRKLQLTTSDGVHSISSVTFAEDLGRVRSKLDTDARRRGVELTWEIESDLPAVRGDAAGIESILTNLVDNALEAAGFGGRVRVVIDVESEAVRLVVEDSGDGIDPEIRSKILDPFFTTKPPGEGIGLGLSVALGVARSVGGTLSFENRPPEEGGGARFAATLPLADPLAGEEQHARIQGGGTEKPTGKAARTGSPPEPAPSADVPTDDAVARDIDILVIDDEAPIRAILRRVFERHGWHVVEAESGEEALAELEANGDAYDVVLSDLKMPGMSGMELLDRVLERRPELEDRTLIMTGDNLAPGPANFLERTELPVVEKPFEISTLIREVSRVARAR